MKKIQLILFLMVFVKTTFAQQQITGKWLSGDGEGITEIYQQQDKYFGKITWLKKPTDDKGKSFTDTENPDKNLRQQPLIGLLILKNFVYQNNEWKSGTIYDPTNGKNYSCTMWLTDNNTLKVRGYWGLFYQTQIWTRIK